MNILVNQPRQELLPAPDARLAQPMQELMVRVMGEAQQRQLRQLMVVGVARGVGASFISQHLALELAEVLGQVLIIEVCAEAGDDEILDGDLERLHATGSLVARTRLSLSTGLRLFGLGSDDSRRLMARLQARFPLVLWDMPPPTVAPVPLIAARVLDAIVLVAQAHKTRRQVARHVRERLEDSGGRVLGMVLNRTSNFIPEWLYRWL